MGMGPIYFLKKRSCHYRYNPFILGPQIVWQSLGRLAINIWQYDLATPTHTVKLIDKISGQH